MKGYVVWKDRRYRVVGMLTHEDTTPDTLRLRPWRGADVMAPVDQVRPWKRGGKRLARGQKVNIRMDTHAELIEVWERGRRRKLTCTFTGLHQLLARQAAVIARNARSKHIGRKP